MANSLKFITFVLCTSILAVKSESNIEACKGCTVYATSSDGYYWGWENENFCRIDIKNCGYSSSYKTTTKIHATTVINAENDDKSSETVKTTSSSTTTTSTSTSSTSEQGTSSSGEIICQECEVTGTGGDGSFWGWENESSCKIDNVKCGFSTSSDANSTESTDKVIYGSDGIPICSNCEPTSTADDLTMWGTENGVACRVISSRCGINISEYPFCNGCTVTATGTDGSLWGWENEKSCLIHEPKCGLVTDDMNGSRSAENELSSSRNTVYISMITVLFGILISLTFN